MITTTHSHILSAKPFLTDPKRILLVDDDEIVLTALATAVERLLPDYQLVTAQNGTAALAELQKQSFDLILTDYDMPHMNGLDLAHAVQQISPGIPVILATGGWSCEEIQAKINSTHLSGFLTKPFSLLQLRELLQQNGL